MAKGGRIAGAVVVLGCCITIAGALLLWLGISEEGRLKTLLDDNPLHMDADLTRAGTYEGTLGKTEPVFHHFTVLLEVDPAAASEDEAYEMLDGLESTLSIYKPAAAVPEEYPVLIWPERRSYPSPKVLLLRLTSTPESGSRVVLDVTSPAAGLATRRSHRLRAAYEPCGLEFFATFVTSAAGVGIMIVGGVTALVAAHVRRSRRKTLAGS